MEGRSESSKAQNHFMRIRVLTDSQAWCSRQAVSDLFLLDVQDTKEGCRADWALLSSSPLLGLWRCFCDRKSNSCDWKAFLLSVMCVGMSIWLRWQQYCVNVSAIEKWFWMHSFVLGRCESLTPGMLKDDVKWGNQLKIKYNIYPLCPCLFTAIRTCNWCPGWNLLLCVQLL